MRLSQKSDSSEQIPRLPLLNLEAGRFTSSFDELRTPCPTAVRQAGVQNDGLFLDSLIQL
jgi:hypothetical protein